MLLDLGEVFHIVLDVVGSGMQKDDVWACRDALETPCLDVVNSLTPVPLALILSKVSSPCTSNKLDLITSAEQALVEWFAVAVAVFRRRTHWAKRTTCAIGDGARALSVKHQRTT